MKAMPLTPDPRYPTYRVWTENGHHAPLDYLDKNHHIRSEPALIGDQLQSAIVFFHPCPREFESQYIARYAWGKDYHHTMKDKLFSLSEEFQKSHFKLTEDRVCVDTAPILERSLAEQSGLGWIAKKWLPHQQKTWLFFYDRRMANISTI